MLHDVTVEIYDPGQGSRREIVRVDAIGGDDAVSKGQTWPEAQGEARTPSRAGGGGGGRRLPG